MSRDEIWPERDWQVEIKALHNLSKIPGGKKFLHNRLVEPSKENIFSGNAQTFDDTSDSALQQFDDGMIRMQIERPQPINHELCHCNDSDGVVAQIRKSSNTQM